MKGTIAKPPKLLDIDEEAATDGLYTPGDVEALERSLKVSQYITAGAIGLCLIMGVIMTVLVNRPEIQPWTVMVDPDIKTLWHGPAASYQLKDLDIAKWLGQWVTWVQERPGPEEGALMRKWWHEALGMTAGDATKALETYLNSVLAANKQNTYNTVRVLVHIKSYEPESSTKYRLTWEEVQTPLYGTPTTVAKSGTFTVSLRATSVGKGVKITAADMNRSPLGIYITSYSFSQTTEVAP